METTVEATAEATAEARAMSRWQAAAIHFGISLGVFLIALAVIISVWYPGILFSIDGGWSGLRIVIAVDLVLGPLLTLIVFKAGKPGLKFDLSCIAALQIVCLAGGLWVVYSERPLALVMAYDTLYSVTADEFRDYDRDVAVLESFPGAYPKLLYTELPENDIRADIVAIRSQFIGDPLFIQTERYRAMPVDNPDTVFRQEQATRTRLREETLAQLPEDCLLSQFISAVTSGFVCLNRDTLKITDFYGMEHVRESAPAAPGNTTPQNGNGND